MEYHTRRQLSIIANTINTFVTAYCAAKAIQTFLFDLNYIMALCKIEGFSFYG